MTRARYISQLYLMIIILFFFSNKVFCKNRILTIIGNTDTQTKQFHQSPNKFEMFLNAYENNRFIESYTISNVLLPQKKNGQGW